MLHHIDSALASLVRSALGDGIEVRVEPPDRDRARVVTGSVVNLFPHRVEEDIEVRAASWTDELDERGRVVARVLPPRRYRFCYLLTAWSESRRTEHELLGAALTALSGTVRLSTSDLPRDLPVVGPVGLDVAHPLLPRATADLWSALGVAPRAHLDVVVTATLAAPSVASSAAPPTTVDLGVARRAPLAAAPRVPVEPPAHRIREQRHGQASRQDG